MREAWAAGNEAKLKENPSLTVQRPVPLVLGDTKYGWPYEEAIAVITSHPDGYDEATNLDNIKPLEQIQHYSALHDTCYQVIFTERAVLGFRLSLSQENKRTAPRPERITSCYST
jgi:hypothetical protein